MSNSDDEDAVRLEMAQVQNTKLGDTAQNGQRTEVDPSALNSLLATFSGDQDNSGLLEQFEAAAKNLPSKIIQLNSPLDGFSNNDVIGAVIIRRKDDSNVMYQITECCHQSGQY
jgi:hypothetical protein